MRTVNSNLNKYKFLITLIHEISHLVAFEKFGRNIKPHGNNEYSFQRLMILYTPRNFSKAATFIGKTFQKPNGQQ
jgi:predicted SprT family Zn-dependent metalloprotease